jgi:hypothetical protein
MVKENEEIREKIDATGVVTRAGVDKLDGDSYLSPVSAR